MYYSKFLPVNIKRKNAAIYTTSTVFPIDLLVMARNALVEGTGVGQDVLLENNNISFVGKEDISWTIPDIYLAYEAYEVALENNFSFYTVCDSDGVPQLFISKSFKNCRVMVNAMTFDTVIVTKPMLVKRISAMIDRQFENKYCMNLFDELADLEKGATHYLDAIIVERGTEEECMVVNPITTLYADDSTIYGKELVEGYKVLLENPEAENEHAAIVDNMFVRKNRKGFAPVTAAHAKYIADTYDRLLAKKCNYLNIVGADCDTHYYVSTNWRYLVNAETFECVVVTNAYIKRLLQSYVTNGDVDLGQLYMCWQVAKRNPT